MTEESAEFERRYRHLSKLPAADFVKVVHDWVERIHVQLGVRRSLGDPSPEYVADTKSLEESLGLLSRILRAYEDFNDSAPTYVSHAPHGPRRN